MAELTSKQKRFVEEYLVDLNATQAAIRAGYSEHTAYAMGYENLRKPEIAAAIQEAQERRSQRTEITQDEVLKELAKLGFANMLDYIAVQEDGTAYVDLSKLTRDQAAAVQEVTVDTYVEGRGDDKVPVKRIRFKLADKRGSLELIGKHLGMFPSRHELSGPGGGPIAVTTWTELVKSAGADDESSE